MLNKLTIVFLVVAFLFGIFLTYTIEESRLRKQEKKLIRIVKERAILEYKYLDTLATIRGYLTTLVSNSNKRIDSLTAITERKRKERIIIRMIKPEILTSAEVLARLKSHYHNYNPPK